MKSDKISQILMIISMIVFGTIGVFIRFINLSSGEIALYRAILASILIGSYLLIKEKKINFKEIKKEIPLLVISGVAMGINWILLFEAYKYTTVSLATICYYFAPVIVTIICPILFKEKLTLKQIICFIASSIGLILITGFNNSSSNSNIIGIVLGLGAACFYASVIILNKYIKKVEGVERTFLQFLSAIIILVPYVLLTSGINLGGLDSKGWVFLIVVGVVHTGITYCMYFSSMKNLSGQRTAILSYIDPLVAVVVSVLILKEDITLLQIIGGILILGFTLLNEIKITKNDNKYIMDDGWEEELQEEARKQRFLKKVKLAMKKKQLYIFGLKDGIPIILGFIPVGIAYAIMARQAGLSVFETCLMSLTVFAGASQMMSTGMIAQGASVVAIIIATFILNLRHIIMSICVYNKMKDSNKGLQIISSFGVTDESFAIFSTIKEEKSSIWFFLGLITVSYSSWNVGTFIGAIASNFLPEIIIASLGVSLYAMFIALLVPSIKGNIKLILLVILTAACNTLLSLVIDSSWSLVISTLLCAFVGVFFVDLKEEKANE